MRGIDPTMWARVSPLLDEALELDHAQRHAFLVRLADDHPAVAAVMAQLLVEHDGLKLSDFLESSSHLADPPQAFAGTAVGAYTLETPLGMGGMGTVWRARRHDGRFEGAVAVKLLHLAGLDSGGAERFAREGTLLARLSHPHIARLLDAGLMPSGQPYLVLEYVDGERIDRYADQRRLDVPARLDLFLQAADAVAHAHANLVVHRDLKPSNILVDASGRVKLLDFGIATLLTGDRVTAADVTLGDGRALTPEYATPEQIAGQPVTVATDGYALGVLLYRLLVDAHPTNTGCVTPAQHVRAISDTDAAIASGALAGPEAERIAAARNTTPAALGRMIRGDLDNILTMALQKVPARRYATVAAFADDVRRHLGNAPIAARPDRWGYRAHKFVRRHTAGVALAAGMLVALAIAAGVVIDRMFEAERQRDEAAFQARRAQASSEFMRYLVTQIGTRAMTMKEVLDQGRAALDRQYGGDAAFQARMLMQLSGPYIELGDYKTAAAMMAHALVIATDLDDPALLASAHCGTGVDLVEQRDFEGARRHLTEGARHAQRTQDEAGGSMTECATGESRLAVAEGRLDEAIGHAARAVELIERTGQTRTTRYTSALSNLAAAYATVGQLAEAVPHQRQVTAISREIGRGRTIGVVVSLQNEGAILRRLGRWIEADTAFVEAETLADAADAGGHVPAYVLVNHARLLVSLARSDEAMSLLQRARAQGDLSDSFAAVGQITEALVIVERGDFAGARGLQAALQPGERSVLPRQYAHVVPIIEALIARGEGRLGDARAVIQHALAGDGYPSAHSHATPELLEQAARLALEAGDVQTAIGQAREAVQVTRAELGGHQPSALMGRARLTLGLALTSAKDVRTARAELEQAVLELDGAAGPAHPWTTEARARLAALP